MTPIKILIVEDEILIADSISRYLEKKGYQILGIAISYEEAVELYGTEKPDLALLDIRLNGEKSGIDFAYFLQEQPESIPFIYLTSQMDMQHINLAKSTFPSSYLSKPIQKDNLFANIEIALHNHQHQKPATTPAISLYDGKKNYVLPIKNILFIQAEHVYVKIHRTIGDHILQRSALKDLLKKLPTEQFVQTHRSFAVNLQQISHWDSENVYIGKEEIPVSRSRRKVVFEMLKRKWRMKKKILTQNKQN